MEAGKQIHSFTLFFHFSKLKKKEKHLFFKSQKYIRPFFIVADWQQSASSPPPSSSFDLRPRSSPGSAWATTSTPSGSPPKAWRASSSRGPAEAGSRPGSGSVMSLSPGSLSASTSRRLAGTVICGGVWCFSTAGAGPSAAAVSGKNTQVCSCSLRQCSYDCSPSLPPSEKGSYDTVNRMLSDELNTVVVSVE